MQIEELIAIGETLQVEFKRDLNDSELVDAAVCLANGQGGTLLVGVTDDGMPVGARPRHGAVTDPRRIEALISNATRPSLEVRVECPSLNGQSLIRIDVPRSPMPVGTSMGRYLRRTLGGDGKPACLPFFVFETLAHTITHDPSTAVVSGARWQDLDPLEIERFRRLARESGGRGDLALSSLSDEDLVRVLGGVDPTHANVGIRRLALLLFGRPEALHRLLPTHELAWQELHGREVRTNEISRLPLLRGFEWICDRFRARNRSVELVDLFRTEIPDYEESAFREAVANALTHRDYAALGAVHIQWTEEGIQVASPGGLPDGVKLDNILTTAPRPRNPALADAFKRAGIVERTGRGVDTIYFGQLRYGRPLPRYEVTSSSVSVTLPGSDANKDFIRWLTTEGRAGREWSLQQLLILRAVSDLRSLSVEDAGRAIQSDPDRARSALGRLVDAGILDARGEGRGRSYHLSSAMYRVLGDRVGYVYARGFEPMQQEQMVLQYAQQHGQITRREAAALCRLSPDQASRLLRRLGAQTETLRLEGERRGARYVWVGSNNAVPRRRK